MAPSCWVATADRYRSAVLVAKGLEVSLLEADSKAQPLVSPGGWGQTCIMGGYCINVLEA